MGVEKSWSEEATPDGGADPSLREQRQHEPESGGQSTIATDTQQPVKRRLRKREVGLGVLALVVTITLFVVAFYYKDELMSTSWVAQFGLFGVLIVAFIAGSTFSITAIPVPYYLVVLALPALISQEWGILAPVWVGLLSALGSSLGQL
ncbi:MAG: hypothetical protein V3S10_04725, partial [Dehalococcoidales bacterium]